MMGGEIKEYYSTTVLHWRRAVPVWTLKIGGDEVAGWVSHLTSCCLFASGAGTSMQQLVVWPSQPAAQQPAAGQTEARSRRSLESIETGKITGLQFSGTVSQSEKILIMIGVMTGKFLITYLFATIIHGEILPGALWTRSRAFVVTFTILLHSFLWTDMALPLSLVS